MCIYKYIYIYIFIYIYIHITYTYIYIYADGCLFEPSFVLQCHETCENVVRNEKDPEKGQNNFAILGVQLRTRKMK